MIQKEKEERIKQNLELLTAPTLFFQTQELIQIVTRSKKDKYKTGFVKEIVKKILGMHRPTGGIAKVEAYTELEELQFVPR